MLTQYTLTMCESMSGCAEASCDCGWFICGRDASQIMAAAMDHLEQGHSTVEETA